MISSVSTCVVMICRRLYGFFVPDAIETFLMSTSTAIIPERKGEERHLHQERSAVQITNYYSADQGRVMVIPPVTLH